MLVSEPPMWMMGLTTIVAVLLIAKWRNNGIQ